MPGFSLHASDDDRKWDDYLRESILHPEVKIVQTFENKMPPQESNFSGSPYKEKELAGPVISEFIKGNGDPKYYTPMKTPAPSGGEKPPGNGAAKPQAAEKPATGGKTQAEDRNSARPADPPVDKSAVPPPAVKKEEGKMIAKSQLTENDLAPSDKYLTHSRGISSWLLTLDHKRIGVDVPGLRPGGLSPGRTVRHADSRAVARPHGRAVP